MSVRVNVRMSKIMRTPNKSGRMYVRDLRQLLNSASSARADGRVRMQLHASN